MSLSEDQLRRDLASAPGDWPKRMRLVEKLADRWAGQELDMLLTASPNAPASEGEMRRVVDFANAHCPGYRGLKHVLGLFLQTHLTSSWAHFIQSQALFHTGDKEAALRHYQTSKSLNPSRCDEELDKLLAARGGLVENAAPATPVPREATPILPVPPKKFSDDSMNRGDERPAEAGGKLQELEPKPEPVHVFDPEVEEGEFTGGFEEHRDESESESAGASGGVKDSAAENREGEKTGRGDSETNPERDSDAEFTDPGGEDRNDSELKSAREEKPDDEDSDSPFHTEPPGEDGEPLKAAKKEDDSREKLSALSIAVIVHVVFLIIFAFWQVVKPRTEPPMFVSSTVTTGDEERPQRVEIKKYQRPRMPSAAARVQVMTAPAISTIAMPEMDQSLSTFDPVGNGDDFGLSMSFGGGGGGGSVSFFGSKSKSKRVVFVVDVSASMGGSKDELMRRELAKSIESLPPTVEYALIFFGGPAWYAGQQVGEAGLEGPFVANVVRDGSRRYVWYEGWSEKERHGGTRTSALYHYSLGEQNLPTGPYRKATKTNLKQTLEQIQRTPLIFGTDWRWPLKMAMNMKPDTIFFMTDGAFGTGRGVSKDDMIRDLLEHNRNTGKARINTICMMVLQARNELEQLARGSGGEFTLVLQDGRAVRGRDLDNL